MAWPVNDSRWDSRWAPPRKADGSCGGLSKVYDDERSRGAAISGQLLAEPSQEDGYEGASARLERALGRLEASVRGLNGRMRAHARIEIDTQRLVNERAKFASELEKANGRAKRLDESAHEVSRRLVDAMETVRQVLAK